MRYVTRASIHVDRAASAWLIRRFVDPDAEFLFVEDPDDLPHGAISFDMIGVELSHRADRVTFETILAVHDLDEPALVSLGQIIHQADVADDLYDAHRRPASMPSYVVCRSSGPTMRFWT